MIEQNVKLQHFTNTVLQDAAEETELALQKLEEKRAHAIATAEDEARGEAYRYIKKETGRIRAEAGRSISRHLMDNKRATYLRRSEIAAEIFEQVKARITEYTQSTAYPEQLVRELKQAIGMFGETSSVTVFLRDEDMSFVPQLREAAAPVEAEFVPGTFALGGLKVDCPENGRRVDASYDTAMEELSGHFAELFGLSLSDELSEA